MSPGSRDMLCSGDRSNYLGGSMQTIEARILSYLSLMVPFLSFSIPRRSSSQWPSVGYLISSHRHAFDHECSISGLTLGSPNGIFFSRLHPRWQYSFIKTKLIDSACPGFLSVCCGFSLRILLFLAQKHVRISA